MASKHLTLRIDASTLARLDEESERSGKNRSELARTLIEEGLRMASHPGIVFRDGVTGRRPAVAGGTQVWVVVRVFREMKGSLDEMVRATAELMDQSEHNVLVAAQYYHEFQEEIDAWIEANDREAEIAYAEWVRGRERASA